MGFFQGTQRLKDEFETAVVNEPSVFEPLKFYCIVDKRRNYFSGAISPLFHNIFNIYFQLKESNYMFICEFGCLICIFLNSANLICRSTDISNHFRGSLGLRDNESRLFLASFC